MKLNIQFANGEERMIDLPNATDFKIAVGKLYLSQIIQTGPKEFFAVSMIVKVEECDAG